MAYFSHQLILYRNSPQGLIVVKFWLVILMIRDQLQDRVCTLIPTWSHESQRNNLQLHALEEKWIIKLWIILPLSSCGLNLSCLNYMLTKLHQLYYATISHKFLYARPITWSWIYILFVGGLYQTSFKSNVYLRLHK